MAFKRKQLRADSFLFLLFLGIASEADAELVEDLMIHFP